MKKEGKARNIFKFIIYILLIIISCLIIVFSSKRANNFMNLSVKSNDQVLVYFGYYFGGSIVLIGGIIGFGLWNFMIKKFFKNKSTKIQQTEEIIEDKETKEKLETFSKLITKYKDEIKKEKYPQALKTTNKILKYYKEEVENYKNNRFYQQTEEKKKLIQKIKKLQKLNK